MPMSMCQYILMSLHVPSTWSVYLVSSLYVSTPSLLCLAGLSSYLAACSSRGRHIAIPMATLWSSCETCQSKPCFDIHGGWCCVGGVWAGRHAVCGGPLYNKWCNVVEIVGGWLICSITTQARGVSPQGFSTRVVLDRQGVWGPLCRAISGSRAKWCMQILQPVLSPVVVNS